MKQDNLYFDSKERMQKGIAKVARAVGGTMGTGGSNAILEKMEQPGHITTNDGYSIANDIVLADPIEEMGRKILLESINRANKASGDGSSTTCVLTEAIIRIGEEMKGDTHPMDLKRQMEACLPIIEASLRDQTKNIVEDGNLNVTLLEQVATISAEDESIGKMIADIYTQIGDKGIVYWDVSKTAEDTYTIGSGITLDGASYLTPYMCDLESDGTSKQQVRMKNPKILITKQKISGAADFEKLAAELDSKNHKDLIVFCDEIDPLVIPSLVQTRMQRGFRIVPVNMPVLWKDEWYEDLALATGATVVDPAAGLSMKDAKVDHLGTVQNLIVTKDDTHLDGIADLSEYVAKLEAENEDAATLRASRLNTKTARYFVGAHSDSALSYRRLKVEDAIGAAYQALNGGIVPGGGVALFNAARYMPDTVGGKILATSLPCLVSQICANAGLNSVPDGVGEGMGVDTRTRDTVDMFKAGITDPKNVVYNAVQNAVSVASTVLTAPTIVTLPREEPDRNPLDGPVMR